MALLAPEYFLLFFIEGSQDSLKKKHQLNVCCFSKLRVHKIGVSKNNGTPESSILIGFSIINHPFWGTPYFWKHPNPK